MNISRKYWNRENFCLQCFDGFVYKSIHLYTNVLGAPGQYLTIFGKCISV
ncbi:unnamed protein product [Larinioides sclopetarius]|uniref:Uncharacterized protein n=1 Tax=Larinioides sclopetarius TaxID=280406 RepID=A0AAV1YYD9_9ARAC